MGWGLLCIWIQLISVSKDYANSYKSFLFYLVFYNIACL